MNGNSQWSAKSERGAAGQPQATSSADRCRQAMSATASAATERPIASPVNRPARRASSACWRASMAWRTVSQKASRCSFSSKMDMACFPVMHGSPCHRREGAAVAPPRVSCRTRWPQQLRQQPQACPPGRRAAGRHRHHPAPTPLHLRVRRWTVRLRDIRCG